VDIACALMIDAVLDGLVIPPECLQKLDDFRGFLISKNGQLQRKLFAMTRQFIVPALSGENEDRHVLANEDWGVQAHLQQIGVDSIRRLELLRRRSRRHPPSNSRPPLPEKPSVKRESAQA
jgi:hypothetical protein